MCYRNKLDEVSKFSLLPASINNGASHKHTLKLSAKHVKKTIMNIITSKNTNMLYKCIITSGKSISNVEIYKNLYGGKKERKKSIMNLCIQEKKNPIKHKFES